jgi:hypothetical protein
MVVGPLIRFPGVTFKLKRDESEPPWNKFTVRHPPVPPVCQVNAP